MKDNVLTYFPFEIESQYNFEADQNLFSGIKFFLVPGYDSIDEFKTLPSGEFHLEMAESIRKSLDGF